MAGQRALDAPACPRGPQGSRELLPGSLRAAGAPSEGASRRHYAGGFKWIQWRTRGTMDRSPNDDRSDSMNPNNDAYDASEENREEQLAENEKD